MWLPNVTEEGWREFQAILAAEFAIVVNDSEAKRLAQKVLDLTFITEYGHRYLRAKVDRK